MENKIDMDDILKKINLPLLEATVLQLKSITSLIADTAYPHKADMISTIFMRNVFLNLLGGFIFETTNYERENALDINIESILKDMENWFKNVRKQLAEHKEGCN